MRRVAAWLVVLSPFVAAAGVLGVVAPRVLLLVAGFGCFLCVWVWALEELER